VESSGHIGCVLMEEGVTYSICGDCYDYLYELNPDAARVWLNLCTIYISNRACFGFKEINEELTQILEEEGYISTTEDEEYTIFRPLGYEVYNDLESFCVCEKE